MKHAKVPRCVLIGLIAVSVISSVGLGVAWFGNRDLRNDVERLEAGIRNAQGLASVVVGELNGSRGEVEELKRQLGESLATVERLQNDGAELGSAIENSSDASCLIAGSIDRIGEWIESVERANKEGED